MRCCSCGADNIGPNSDICGGFTCEDMHLQCLQCNILSNKRCSKCGQVTRYVQMVVRSVTPTDSDRSHSDADKSESEENGMGDHKSEEGAAVELKGETRTDGRVEEEEEEEEEEQEEEVMASVIEVRHEKSTKVNEERHLENDTASVSEKTLQCEMSCRWHSCSYSTKSSTPQSQIVGNAEPIVHVVKVEVEPDYREGRTDARKDEASSGMILDRGSLVSTQTQKTFHTFENIASIESTTIRLYEHGRSEVCIISCRDLSKAGASQSRCNVIDEVERSFKQVGGPEQSVNDGGRGVKSDETVGKGEGEEEKREKGKEERGPEKKERVEKWKEERNEGKAEKNKREVEWKEKKEEKKEREEDDREEEKKQREEENEEEKEKEKKERREEIRERFAKLREAMSVGAKETETLCSPDTWSCRQSTECLILYRDLKCMSSGSESEILKLLGRAGNSTAALGESASLGNVRQSSELFQISSDISPPPPAIGERATSNSSLLAELRQRRVEEVCAKGECTFNGIVLDDIDPESLLMEEACSDGSDGTLINFFNDLEVEEKQTPIPASSSRSAKGSLGQEANTSSVDIGSFCALLPQTRSSIQFPSTSRGGGLLCLPIVPLHTDHLGEWQSAIVCPDSQCRKVVMLPDIVKHFTGDHHLQAKAVPLGVPKCFVMSAHLARTEHQRLSHVFLVCETSTIFGRCPCKLLLPMMLMSTRISTPKNGDYLMIWIYGFRHAKLPHKVHLRVLTTIPCPTPGTICSLPTTLLVHDVCQISSPRAIFRGEQRLLLDWKELEVLTNYGRKLLKIELSVS